MAKQPSFFSSVRGSRSPTLLEDRNQKLAPLLPPSSTSRHAVIRTARRPDVESSFPNKRRAWPGCKAGSAAARHLQSTAMTGDAIPGQSAMAPVAGSPTESTQHPPKPHPSLRLLLASSVTETKVRQAPTPADEPLVIKRDVVGVGDRLNLAHFTQRRKPNPFPKSLPHPATPPQATHARVRRVEQLVTQ